MGGFEEVLWADDLAFEERCEGWMIISQAYKCVSNCNFDPWRPSLYLGSVSIHTRTTLPDPHL